MTSLFTIFNLIIYIWLLFFYYRYYFHSNSSSGTSSRNSSIVNINTIIISVWIYNFCEIRGVREVLNCV